MEWVEVKAPTVELAVAAAVDELGLTSPEQVSVEVLEEPERGFLGIGRKDAVVRVKPKPKKRRRRRPPKKSGTTQGNSSKNRSTGRAPKGKVAKVKTPDTEPDESGPSPEGVRQEQAKVIAGFLEGLLDAFGLEGTVSTRVEDGILYADITGSQAEALIGPHGTILQAVHELTKTVIQRKSREPARLRLDIGGYQERRKEALRIYAARLAQQVIDEQTEIMLEPMNAAERKVIHDAVAEIEGARTFSEGEEPRRSVVIAPEGNS